MSLEYRQASRRRWARSAAGWERVADAFRRDTMPVTSWMLDAAQLQPGHAVLELAAGIGDTGFLAAELVAPGGTLITSDFAPEMLSAAQRRAEALGVANARFRQLDAEVIDQPAASLDAVLCRWGYMLMADPEAALRDTRRVLRPGGRLALAAWTGPADNPWSSVPVAELIARGLIEEDEGAPGQYAWAREGLIAEQLEAAGFVEYEVDTVGFTWRHASPRAWWESAKATSMRTADAAAAMTGAQEDEIVATLAERAAAWQGEDGALAIPARTWVAAATA